MQVPTRHKQSRLSIAYIMAMVTAAGYVWQETNAGDYGIDGIIQKVVRVGKQYRAAANGVHVQVKSTYNFIKHDDHITYALEASAYNKLVTRVDDDDGPILLLLYCMPRDEQTWVQASEDVLKLHHCCYWMHLDSVQTSNTSSITLTVPRAQQFDIGAVDYIYSHFRVLPRKVTM